MNIINVGYDSANYYVLGSGSGRLLIDAGWPGTLPRLLASLKHMGIDLSEIGYMLVTHYHPDHAGLVQELKALGVRLILADLQAPAVHLLRTFMNPSVPYVQIRLDDNPQIKLDGSRAFLVGIGIAGSIIHTPGHTDDSVSLVLDEGDAFTGDLHPAGMVDPSILPLVINSWQAVGALGGARVHPGHGPIRSISDMLS
jgi:ribonuclease/clavin/mitogillin